MPSKRWSRKIPNGKSIDGLIRSDNHKAAIAALNGSHNFLKERSKRTMILAKKSSPKEHARLRSRAIADAKKAQQIHEFLHGKK